LAVPEECDKEDFNFQNQIFGKAFHTMSFEAISV
jgi:hypothetical protein